MTEPSGSPGRQGQPRTERDAAFLERFDSAIRLPLIISAILPLIVVPEQGNWVSVVIGVVTWLVFLVDYVVHERHLQHFGRTAFGRFDLVIVIATAPWFLLPGAHGGSSWSSSGWPGSAGSSWPARSRASSSTDWVGSAQWPSVCW